MASSTRIHVALLDCDTPVPLVLAERGMYSDIFRGLIIDAAEKQLGKSKKVKWEFSTYHCVKGELPHENKLEDIDAVLITGSASSAYDDDLWIKNLITFTRNTYNQYPQILFFGSCFGHQLICQALFTPSPPQTSIVTRSPHGWELGIHPIRLSPQFLAHFGPITNNENAPAGSDLVRMQFVHADHVSVSVMPKGFANIGSTEACEIQGVWKKNRVLTYQGHIEFDEFVNKETIKVFGTTCGWDNERMRCALEMTEGVDDAGWASSVLFKFLMEGIEERDERQRESVVVPLLVPVVRETCSAQNNVVEKGLDWKGVEVKEMEVGA